MVSILSKSPDEKAGPSLFSRNIIFSLTKGQKRDQKDNFFLNNFTNHVLSPIELKLKVLSDQFEKVAQSAMVGLSDIAKYTNAGEEVSNNVKVHVPYKLWLVPNQELKEQMNQIILEEPDASLTDRLSRIDSDTTLYEVHALETPTSEAELIGKLSITSKLTSSVFGDKELLFQHQDMKDDWEIHDISNPEWKKDYAKERKDFEDANPVFGCPFANTKSLLLKVAQKVSQPICGGVNLISRIRKQ